MGHIAEAAVSGTSIPKDEESSRPPSETVALIGAPRTLANGMETEFFGERFHSPQAGKIDLFFEPKGFFHGHDLMITETR